MIASAITLVILLLAAGAILAAQARQLDRTVNDALSSSVTDVQNTLDVAIRGRDGRGPFRGRGEQFLVLAANSRRDLQVVRRDGVVEISTGSLSRDVALVDPDELFDDRLAGEFRTVRYPGVGEDGRTNEPYRVVFGQIGPDRAIVVGYSMHDVEEARTALRRSLLVAVPSLVAVIAGLIWLVTGRALGGVDAMRRQVDAIGATDLDRRVTPPDTLELARLAGTMNSMLDRLQTASDRQHRFVADASHELRSPLAGIRGQLEVNLAHPDAPGRAEAERDMLDETIRMQRLVDDLLALARVGADRQHVRTAVIDLDDVVLEEVAAIRTQRPDVRFDESQLSAARAEGDPEQLRRVVRNLLSNAGRHATSTVWITLREVDDAGTVLVVEDDGPGVPPEFVPALFDRFARADDARARDSGGSGLGLAICREIVEAHGGTIRLVPEQRGARFVVSLPPSEEA